MASQRERKAIIGLAVLGAVLGAAAKEADQSGFGWASDLGTYPAAWVLLLALIAWRAPGPLRAAVRSAAFFAPMIVAYYAWAHFMLGFPLDRHLMLWLAAAVTVVPALAAGVRWACRDKGPLAGLVLATVAALALTDGTAWQLWWAWVQGGAPEGFLLRPVQALVGLAAVLVIIGLLPRNNVTRLWAAILTVPMVMIVPRLVDRVLGMLLGLL